jgi:dimeric dUTPase (all-alpha-NTP-PPase superfamily)
MDDRLEEMFIAQEKLQRDTYRVDFYGLQGDHDRRAEYVRMNALAAMVELTEALNEVGWKPWATNRVMNTDAMIGELVDVWHFMLNMMLASGRDPRTLAKLFQEKYLAKNQVNTRRQLEGYDGVKTKCPHCARDLEEAQVGFTQDSDGQISMLWCGGCNQSLNWMDLPPRVQENLA